MLPNTWKTVTFCLGLSAAGYAICADMPGPLNNTQTTVKPARILAEAPAEPEILPVKWEPTVIGAPILKSIEIKEFDLPLTPKEKEEINSLMKAMPPIELPLPALPSARIETAKAEPPAKLNISRVEPTDLKAEIPPLPGLQDLPSLPMIKRDEPKKDPLMELPKLEVPSGKATVVSVPPLDLEGTIKPVEVPSRPMIDLPSAPVVETTPAPIRLITAEEKPLAEKKETVKPTPKGIDKPEDKKVEQPATVPTTTKPTQALEKATVPSAAPVVVENPPAKVEVAPPGLTASTIPPVAVAPPAMKPVEASAALTRPVVTSPVKPEMQEHTVRLSQAKLVITLGDGKPRFEVRHLETKQCLFKANADGIDITRWNVNSQDNKGEILQRLNAMGNITFTGPDVEGTCDELSILAGTGEVLLKGNVQLKTKSLKNLSALKAEKIVYQIGLPSLAKAQPPVVSETYIPQDNTRLKNTVPATMIPVKNDGKASPFEPFEKTR